MDIKIEPKEELDLSDFDENENNLTNDIYPKSLTFKRELSGNSSCDEFIIPDDGELEATNINYNDLNESNIENVVNTSEDLRHTSESECSSNKGRLVIKSETDSSEKYESTTNSDLNNSDETNGKYLINQLPFKCNFCDYTADSRFRIEIHEKHYHREGEKLFEDHYQLFVCDKCPFSSRFKPKYLFHKMNHYQFKCDICPYASCRWESLRKHRNMDPVKHYRYRKFALAMQNKLNNISSEGWNNEVLIKKSDSDLTKTGSVFDEAIDETSLDAFKERYRSSLEKKPMELSSNDDKNEFSYNNFKSSEIQKEADDKSPTFQSQTFATDGSSNIPGGVAIGGVQLFVLEMGDQNTTNSQEGNDKSDLPTNYHNLTDIKSAELTNIDNDESITNGGTIYVITDTVNQEDCTNIPISSKNDSNSYGQTIALSACENLPKDASSLVLLQVLEEPNMLETNLQNRDIDPVRHSPRKNTNAPKHCYDLNYDDDGLYEETEKVYTKQVPLILKPKKPRPSKRFLKEVPETIKSNEKAKIPQLKLVGKVSHEEKVQKPSHKTISEDEKSDDNLKSKDSQPSISCTMARKIFAERIEKVLASFTPSVEANSLPGEAKSLPREAESVPREARNFPREAKSVPREVRNFYREARDFPREAKSFPREVRSLPREAKSLPHEAKSVPHEDKNVPHEANSVSHEANSVLDEAKNLKSIPKNRVRSKRKCTEIQKRCYDLHYDDDGLYDAKEVEEIYAEQNSPSLEKKRKIILIDLVDDTDSDTTDSLKSNSNSNKSSEKPWYEIIHDDETDNEV